MDFWWLYVGALLLAIGASLSALGRSYEMATVANESEVASGIAAGKFWEDLGSLTNAVGSFVVAGGALMSVLNTNYGVGGILAIIFYFLIMIGIGVILIRGHCVRRKMIARQKAKIRKEEQKRLQDQG